MRDRVQPVGEVAPGAVADAGTAATCTHPSRPNQDAGVDHVRYELLEGAPRAHHLVVEEGLPRPPGK
ncbi:hypothetical protein [Streptomyces sp. NPDC002215]|uniref:hypothetical protein n=1 Tax=Streptomyces sp. NPDC002215 TaxID=3154412 RepID=UPI0033176550